MSRSPRVLVIDDDPALLDLVRFTLEEAGYEVADAGSAEEGLDRLRDVRPDLAILDLHLPGRPGLEFLALAKKRAPELPVIVLTAEDELDEVVACMRAGAFDFVRKPFDATRLLTSVRNAEEHHRLRSSLDRVTNELRRDQGFDAILGRSPELAGSISLLKRATETDVSVLLTGETGTGKEVAACALHAESSRRSGPFVAVNCGAIPENLIESELFGHEAGSFTGAERTRIGRFEQADGGTLFLDEIGELRPDLQVRLLRVLQERIIDRVGGNEPVPVDVRVIAATHRDLRADAARGTFREDLYYRLAVFPVNLPPLRDRSGDLEILSEFFLTRFAKEHDRKVRSFSPGAWEALGRYVWPGNIRELMNVIERAVIIEDGPVLGLASLPTEFQRSERSAFSDSSWPFAGDAIDMSAPAPVSPAAIASRFAVDTATAAQTSVVSDLDVLSVSARPQSLDPSTEITPFEEQEEAIIRVALEHCDWNVKLAAKKLKLGRATIYRKIEKYGLNRELQIPTSLEGD